MEGTAAPQREEASVQLLPGVNVSQAQPSECVRTADIMTIFTILLPREQPKLVEKIKLEYQTNGLQITETQWLVSASGTALEVSKKLGIYDPANPNGPSSGDAIIFSTNGYFGRAPANVWEWIGAKLQSPPQAASG